MQSTSCEMLGCMKHKLESRLPGEMSITSDDTTLMVKSIEELKSILMKVKEEWKCWLKTQHSENQDHGICSYHFMANRGGKMETMRKFILRGCKITTDGNFCHEIKRHLLLGRKAMTNLDRELKSRDIILLTKVHLVKAMIFPVVMYGCESWTIKKAEHQRVDAFKLWCWRRLLRVPWTARRSNQAIVKEISPEYSLEGQMLKLQFTFSFSYLYQYGLICCCSVAMLYPTLCDPMDCSTPGCTILHYLPELVQTHVRWVGDAIQPSHSLSSPSPPALTLSHHQGLFLWIGSSRHVAKVRGLQHQYFQWIFRIDFL